MQSTFATPFEFDNVFIVPPEYYKRAALNSVNATSDQELDEQS